MTTSRRTFLKSAAAAAVSAGALTREAWATTKIPEKWDETYDVVIVGYGGSGANAALAASEAGSTVCILEKLDEAGGNTFVASGNFLMIKDKEKAKSYFRRLFDYSHCELSEELLEAYVEGMKDTVNWMKHLDPEVNVREVNRSSHPHVPDSESMWCCTIMSGEANTGGQRLFNFLDKQVRRHQGVTIKMETPVQKLVMKDGAAAGVIAKTKDGREISVKARKGVILACGGYENDPVTKKNFNLGDPIGILGTPGNTGDGLRMAEAAGAALWHMSGMACPIGTVIPGKKTQKIFNTNQNGFILVDQNGRRFANEKEMEIHCAVLYVNYFDSYAMKYPRIPCYAIFDQNSKEFGGFAPSYGSGYPQVREGWKWSKDNQQEIDLGVVKVANTVEELAEKINVPVENLKTTIDMWNEDIGGEKKKDRMFGRIVEGKLVGQVWPYKERSAVQAAPLNRPPYYAIALQPTILNTQGGPRRSGKSEVLNPYGEPIPRLFACGELGSLWGFIYQGCGNIAEAIIFGRYAGENASKLAPWD